MTLIDQLVGRLWAGTEESLQSLMVAAESASRRAGSFDLDDDDDEVEPPIPRLVQKVGGVGIVHVKGPLVSSDSFWNYIFGLTSYNEVRRALVAVAEDESVGAILLAMDTPGGAVSGMSDIADLVSSIDQNIKPVLAHTSGMMASAGYFIGSCARWVGASRMADVGSIGVLQIVREQSKAEAQAGITTTVIRSGKYKALGNPYEPLTDLARETLQASCDYSYSLFVQHVAQRRGTSAEVVVAQMAEGRVFTGAQAEAVKLIDEVCTFDAALAKATEIADGDLARAANSPQYGLSPDGTLSMKKATINPITVAAAQALAAKAAAADAAGKPEDTQAKAEVSASADAPGKPEDVATATDTQVGAQDAAQSDTALAGQVELLQGQLAAAQDQVVDLKLKVRELEKAAEVAAESTKGMRAVVAQSVNYLQVALNQAAADVSGLADTMLLAEHSRLQAQFDANYKAGGVAAVSASADAEQSGSASDARIHRVKAASLTKRK